MKRNILLVLISVFLGLNNSYAQTYKLNKKLTIYTPKLKESKEALDVFIARNATKLIRSEQNEYLVLGEFELDKTKLSALDSLGKKIGYITENNFNAENTRDKKVLIEDELAEEEEALKENKAKLENATLEKKETSYYQSRAQEAERNIKRLKKLLREFSNNDSTVGVSVRIYDEISTPSSSGRISFVNMPGFEMGYLFVENPKAGQSSSMYRSFACKYLFTRGKSYFTLGVYKDEKTNDIDTGRIREMFFLNFGQDFYPKHFGRGKRKYLNLYTGYQIGGFISNTNGDKTSNFIPNANISLGLELFKSKHVLIDNKASYFMPLNELNRNLRGLVYNVSFNFVF
ncbi:MAG: hypothetical protein V4538_06620 [Bacteroidota bacterium]